MVDRDRRDPARSQVWRALGHELHGVRLALGGSLAIVVYRPRSSRSHEVLGVDSDEPTRLCPYEPIEFSRPIPRNAMSMKELTVTSSMRPFAEQMEGVLVVPFADGGGTGALVVSTVSAPTAAESDDVRALFEQVSALREHAGRVRHRDLDKAYRVVAQAATSAVSPDRAVDVMLGCARTLFDSDVAYLAHSVDDVTFAFSRTLGIRTPEFRNMRIGESEGLGGAVRTNGTPIRMLDYQRQARGQDVRARTQREGIYSAMATPVFDDSRVEAVLYVGHRAPHAYSADDETALLEFSDAALLGINKQQLDRHVSDTARNAERTRIARFLHDDLIRRLTKIGYLADDLGSGIPSHAAEGVTTISRTIEECLNMVRGQIDFAALPETPMDTFGSITETIFEVPTLTGMTRTTSFDDPSMLRTRVPAHIAEAMIRIGQEAVFNAEHHSNGSRCTVEFDCDEAAFTMNIVDDGAGLDVTRARSDMSHFGMGMIRDAAARVGGTVHITDAGGTGTAIRCRFPRTW